METRTTSGYFSGFSILSLVLGVGFFCVCLIFWWFTRQKAVIVFGAAMFFGGVANSLACRVLDRMEVAGYEVGYWRWLTKDLKIYSEYWRIAPNRGWSRLTLSGSLLCFLLAAAFLFSIPTIAGHLSHGPIIDGYNSAPCIPVSANRKVGGPHTRDWETPVTLTDGVKVTVVGYQMPGGRITARYETTGRELEVANAGDYVYPSDVRFNARTNLLFVKASGLAGGIIHETWLFEYDLLGQRLIERRRVADRALPTECPESP